jgi:hypothetical protein
MNIRTEAHNETASGAEKSESPVSQAQANVLLYLPMISGSLSVLGSSLLLVSLSRMKLTENGLSTLRRSRRKGSPSRVYRRILAAMSLLDIVYSLSSCVFAIFLNMNDIMDVTEGYGTRFSCSLGGFLVQWGFGSFAYGAWLNLYYLLTIRYNIREETLVKTFEPIAHFSVFVFYFGTALIAACIGLMNPTGGPNCGIISYPMGCGYFDYLPCTRGEHFREAALLMVLIPSYFCVIVIITSLCLIAHAVWRQRTVAREQQQRIAEPTVVFDEAEPVPKSSSTSLERLSNETITQCIFSGATFANSIVWATIGYVILLSGEGMRLGDDLYWVR